MTKSKWMGRQLQPARDEGEGGLVGGWREEPGEGCRGPGAGRFWNKEGLGKLL